MTESHFAQQPKQFPILKLAGWLAVVLIVGLLLSSVPGRVVQAQVGTGPAEGRQVNLETQLRIGLKAFTPGDFAFIRRVVMEVERGRLPRRLVDTTFVWARDRAVRRSYTRQFRPIVYFQPGLTIQARAIGVSL